MLEILLDNDSNGCLILAADLPPSLSGLDSPSNCDSEAIACFIHPETREKLGASGQIWTSLHHSIADECTRLFVGADIPVPALLYTASYT